MKITQCKKCREMFFGDGNICYWCRNPTEKRIKRDIKKYLK